MFTLTSFARRVALLGAAALLPLGSAWAADAPPAVAAAADIESVTDCPAGKDIPWDVSDR